ncbi:MAG: hypothetical protein KBT00_08165 [Bacteroidales bacterium]|nr:hypothetical protein [Candidatus Cacconaster merdequi]
MKRFLTIIAAALTLIPATTSHAQTKAETRLYEKTTAKPSIKAYEKFLKKYPQSIYADRISFSRDSLIFSTIDKDSDLALEQYIEKYPSSAMRSAADSLISKLRISSISAEYATELSIKTLKENGITSDITAESASFRYHGDEYIASIVFGAEESGADTYSIFILKQSGEGWTVAGRIVKERNFLSDGLTVVSAVDDAVWTDVNGKRYLEFSYVNTGESGFRSGKEVEYVTNLIDLESGNLYSAIFYGKALTGMKIEGRTPDILAGGLILPEQTYLVDAMKNNERLVPIAEADALTDEAIGWWRSKNPRAETTAKTLSFGQIESNCGIVSRFKKESKENSQSYSAALFDIRGYTVICSLNKKTGKYSLVWAEPMAVDKNRDKLLNSIYFENDSTLCLYYYQGRKTFKIKVNLTSKAVSR